MKRKAAPVKSAFATEEIRLEANCAISDCTIQRTGDRSMKRKRAPVKAPSQAPSRNAPKDLLADLRGMIVNARQIVATTVNTALTLLHWQIGKRIREDILQKERAGYREEVRALLTGVFRPQ